jgi:hypothetical protein
MVTPTAISRLFGDIHRPLGIEVSEEQGRRIGSDAAVNFATQDGAD